MKNSILLFLILCVFGTTQLTAQNIETSEFSQVLSHKPTNAGTEFYFSMPSSWITGGTNDDTYLYISSGVATKVVVEVKSQQFQSVRTTVPNGIISVRVPANASEVYSKTDIMPTPPNQVYKGKSIHIYAEDPIIVYAVHRRQYTSDALLAIPVSALGTDYSIASYGDIADNVTQWLPSQAVVTATQNNTKVIFTMGGTPNSRTVFKDGDSLRPGQTKSVVLQQGDSWALSSLGAAADLSGSTIVADKPVALVDGNYCAYIPLNTPACDYICEMELPKNTWGTVYHVTPILTRLKNSWIRIFAKEPNTTVYRDGLELATIRKAGGMLGEGWWDGRIDSLNEVRSHTISSDKPIYVMQFNPGQSDDNVPSDPFQLVLTPIEQYQYDFVFATPGVSGSNEGFSSNYVNIVFEAEVDSAGVAQVPSGLEIAEPNGNSWAWKNIANTFGSTILPADRFTVATGTGNPRVDNKVFGGKRLTLRQGTVYRIRSNKPTAAYVYGFSNFDSYGNPAGAFVADVATPDRIPPKISYSITPNAIEVSGIVSDELQGDSTRANLSAIRLVRPDSSFNYKLEYSSFIPGVDSLASWRLLVIDSAKNARAHVVFNDKAGNATTLLVQYKAPNTTSVEQEYTNSLEQSFPNPSGNFSVIDYELAYSGHVTIELYDAQGHLVKVLHDAVESAGKHSLRIETNNLPSGMYLYKIMAGKFISQRTMIIAK